MLFLSSLQEQRLDSLLPALEHLVAAGTVHLSAMGEVARQLAAAGLTVQRSEEQPYPMYRHVLANLADPIGLLPSSASGNMVSSPLRWYEYALAGIPVIAAARPFGEFLCDQTDALLCEDDPAAWEAAIRCLIDNPEQRRSLSKAAHARALEMLADPATAMPWHELIAKLGRPGAGPCSESPAIASEERVLCLLPITSWSLGDIRIRKPLDAWRRIFGGETRLHSVYDFPEDALDWATTVVLQRESDAQILELMEKICGMGKRLVFDIDDLLVATPEFLSVHEHCQRMKPFLETALRKADVITVSTLRLRDQLLPYNDQILVTPNCAHSEHPPTRHDSGEPVTLILASSDTVRVDFILSCLSRLQQESALSLRLLGIGPPGQFFARAGLNIECRDTIDYPGFKALLSEQHNAIGIIPLDDSPFSGCKSAIKYVDYSLAGIPTICSNVPPYADVVEGGINGLLCVNEENAWVSAIKDLATSVARRVVIANNARGFSARGIFPWKWRPDLGNRY